MRFQPPPSLRLYDVPREERTRLGRLARAACRAGQRTPVILTTDQLCPPCLIGRKRGWYPSEPGTIVCHRRRRRLDGTLLGLMLDTLRVLVGARILTMIDTAPLRPETPLGIMLDYFQEEGWLDTDQRRHVDSLSLLVPVDVAIQRQMLGHIGQAWPALAPRPLGIQAALSHLVAEE